MNRKVVLILLLQVVPALIGIVSGQTVATQFLDPHNKARREVNVPNLIWNQTLVNYAQNWANSRAKNSCRMEHSNGRYGENLFWASWSNTPLDAVQAWVNEKSDYNYTSNTCKSGKVCGHYTQVVWKSTTKLGCASAACSGGGTFTVCSYDPPGNFVGRKPY